MSNNSFDDAQHWLFAETISLLAACSTIGPLYAVSHLRGLLTAQADHTLCFLAALGMYAFLGLLMDGPATLASSLIGLKIAPHFDKPFLTSSVSDFWSRRWNLTAGNALRFLVNLHSPKVFVINYHGIQYSSRCKSDLSLKSSVGAPGV